jgi:hypothetical protein
MNADIMRQIQWRSENEGGVPGALGRSGASAGCMYIYPQTHKKVQF